MSKDGRKMSPMHVTLKAGVMRSQEQDCEYIILFNLDKSSIFNSKDCTEKCLALNELFSKAGKQKHDLQ